MQIQLQKFQEKAPFVAKAEKRKTEYNKNMLAYNKKLVFRSLISWSSCCTVDFEGF